MSVELVRQQCITLLDGLSDIFADTTAADRVEQARQYVHQDIKTGRSRLSAFLPARTGTPWKPEVTLQDIVGIIRLAHRQGLIADDDYVDFKQFHLDQRELLRGEQVVDAITMLQRSLDAYARRTR